MSSEQENNKRIAKNTFFLYIRMFITMLVGLYTSRIVLDNLGVSDYGIYNVMGGVIGMLVYVNQLLSGGTSRFLTIDLGRRDIECLRQTFSISNTLALASCLIILVLGETVGLWFMNTHLNIDPARMPAANWVYQCALVSCLLAVLQNPFTASIIAHEKMGIYAYMSIFDVGVKLFIAFMLSWSEFDKLKLFAFLILASNLINAIICAAVSLYQFEESNLRLAYSHEKFKDMMNYSGWNMIGGFANVLNNYGLNILLNIFFGTLINGARGIALQVSNIVQQFYSSFQTASVPQIIKYYAQGDLKGMGHLICNSSKYGAYLLLCIIMPIVFNIDDFLMIWLGQRPEYTSWFTRLILFQILFQAIDVPVGNGIQAVGRMKLPNLTAALFYLSVFPLSYMAFKFGADPVMGYCIYLIFTPFIMLVDLLILRKYTGFSLRMFISKVLSPLFLVILVISLASYFIMRFITGDGFFMFATRCIFCFVITCVVILWGGVSRSVRLQIFNGLVKKFSGQGV